MAEGANMNMADKRGKLEWIVAVVHYTHPWPSMICIFIHLLGCVCVTAFRMIFDLSVKIVTFCWAEHLFNRNPVCIYNADNELERVRASTLWQYLVVYFSRI